MASKPTPKKKLKGKKAKKKRGAVMFPGLTKGKGGY